MKPQRLITAASLLLWAAPLLSAAAAQPTATLTADPSAVQAGQQVTLSWACTGAEWANGSWTTQTLAPTGTVQVTVTGETTFVLDCAHQPALETATASAPVGIIEPTPTPAPPPTPGLPAPTLSCSDVGSGQVTCTWQAPDGATGCVASGDWSGDKATSGSETFAASPGTHNYLLSCSTDSQPAESSVDVPEPPTPTPTPTPAPSGGLLQPSDLTYAGYYTIPHWPFGATGDRCDEYGHKYYGDVIAYKDDTQQMFVLPHDYCAGSVSLWNFPAGDPSTHQAMVPVMQYWPGVGGAAGNGKDVVPTWNLTTTAGTPVGTQMCSAGWDSHNQRLYVGRCYTYSTSNFAGTENDYTAVDVSGATYGPWDFCSNRSCVSAPSTLDFQPGTDIAYLGHGYHSGGAGSGTGGQIFELDFSQPTPVETDRVTHFYASGGTGDLNFACSISGPENCPPEDGGTGVKCPGAGSCTANTGYDGGYHMGGGFRGKGTAVIGDTVLTSVETGERCFYGTGAEFNACFGFRPYFDNSKGYQLDRYHTVLEFIDKTKFGVVNPNDLYYYAFKDLTSVLGGPSNVYGEPENFNANIKIGTLTVDRAGRRLFLAQSQYPNGMRINVFTW